MLTKRSTYRARKTYAGLRKAINGGCWTDLLGEGIDLFGEYCMGTKDWNGKGQR